MAAGMSLSAGTTRDDSEGMSWRSVSDVGTVAGKSSIVLEGFVLQEQ